MKRISVKKCAIVLGLGLIMSGCASSPQARRDKFLSRGKELLEKRDYPRAYLEFSNASKAMPKDAEPYYYTGMTAMASGDLQKAYLSFRKAVELDPKHVSAKLRIAQLMTAGDKGILANAEKDITELIASGSPTPEMLDTLAVTQLRLGKTEDAVQVLEQALTQSPGEFVTSLLLARTKLAQNDVKGAEAILQKAVEASPKLVAAQLVLGRFYLSQKRTAEAEQTIQHALQLEPKNATALRELAVLQNQTGRKKEAEESFKRLASVGEERYKTVYALFLFSEGRRDEAVREFEKLVKSDPQSRSARSSLVVAYQSVNRPADARRVLDEALRKNPKDLDALLQRGQILTTEGKYTEAEADLNAVVQQNPDGAAGHFALAKVQQAQGRAAQYKQSLFKALELDPTLLAVRLELAGELISKKNAKDALAVLDGAPEGQKKSLTLLAQRNWALWSYGNLQEMRKGIDQGLSQKRSTEFLVQDGLWKLQAGNAAAARASLEEALEINPGDVRALAGLKDAYVMLRQVPMAVQKVKEYAAREPKSPAVQEFLGFVLWASGDRAAARAAFAASKAADPKFERADLAAVQLDAVDAKWDDAAGKLNALLVTNPANSTARLWLGNIQAVQGNQSVALENFRKVLEANPDNAQALNNYAYLLAEHAQKPDEALKYAEKALEKAPDNPEYADTLGWILYRKGLYPSAISYLERAASKGKPVANYHLAMAYAKAGDMKRGRLALDQAMKQNSRLPEAKMAADVLASVK